MDEGVTEGLPTLQSTSGANAHADDDDRLENVQYPYQLYIAPSTSSTERPSPNGPDRPFQCPTCGVRFTRIQNLKQHMLIHSGIKPFQCDRCGKKFTRAYSLKMHRLKHEGKRCFRCQICSATFTSFGEYKHHMRVSRHIIRKPRIYECKTCGAMFTNSGNLIVHLRSLNHEASELANYFQSRLIGFDKPSDVMPGIPPPYISVLLETSRSNGLSGFASLRLYSAKVVRPSSEWGFIDGKPAKNEPNQISQSRRCSRQSS
ncbi:hypothetical protein CIB84_002617 [Bambusicola thoracicus]|uniref:Zinc finger and BTB domain-containing protein 44 n=1 Tax=Bambusicola thoracicus TaxID=9083 RepID=A0A2P4TB88_BAMTH|nr:hypothetical protein CIB84_002617 [Bambusicola thoracicus]